jgi:hypothetical protein
MSGYKTANAHLLQCMKLLDLIKSCIPSVPVIGFDSSVAVCLIPNSPPRHISLLARTTAFELLQTLFEHIQLLFPISSLTNFDEILFYCKSFSSLRPNYKVNKHF